MVLADLLMLLAGALLCNAIPHLVHGLSGRRFPTPFARPSGVGPSPPVVNALWGSANLLVAVLLIWRRPDLVSTWPGLAAAALGFLVTAVFLARHFGRVHGS